MISNTLQGLFAVQALREGLQIGWSVQHTVHARQHLQPKLQELLKDRRVHEVFKSCLLLTLLQILQAPVDTVTPRLEE